MDALAALAHAEQQKIYARIQLSQSDGVVYPAFLDAFPAAPVGGRSIQEQVIAAVKISTAASQKGIPAFKPRGPASAYYMPVMAHTNSEQTGDLLTLISAYKLPGKWANDQTKVLVRMPDGTIALVGMPPYVFQLVVAHRPSILQAFCEQIVHAWTGGLDGFRCGFVHPHLSRLPCGCYLWARNVPDPDRIMQPAADTRIAPAATQSQRPDSSSAAPGDTPAAPVAGQSQRPRGSSIGTPFLGPNGELHIAVPVGVDDSNVQQWFEDIVASGRLAPPATTPGARYSVAAAAPPIPASQESAQLPQATVAKPSASKGRWITLTPQSAAPASAGQDPAPPEQPAPTPAQVGGTGKDRTSPTVEPAPAARRGSQSTSPTTRVARLARSGGPAQQAASVDRRARASRSPESNVRGPRMNPDNHEVIQL